MQNVWNSIENALSSMNPLDWVIALTLAISTITAFIRGFIRSLFALAGMIAGILLAVLYAPRFAKNLVHWIPTPALARLIAFILILAVVYMIAMLMGRLVRGAFSAIGLGFFDRLAGAAFGFARATLFLAALILPLSPYLPQFAMTRSSVLLPYLLPAAHGISFVMPRDVGIHSPAGLWRIRAGQLAGSALVQPHSQSAKDLR